MPRQITLEQLRKAGACKEQRELFRKLFGKAVTVSKELAEKHAAAFSWDWAATHLLSAPAQAEYDRVTASAWAEYDRVTAPAWAEYDRVVTAPAWAEYNRVVTASAWAEYDRVRASAQAEYHRVTASAWAEYDRVRASAFLQAYEGDAQ